MSPRGLVLFALVPLGCSYQQRWNATCDISLSFICTQRVQCGQIPDQSQCEDEIREELMCDPAATLEELQACRAAASKGSCEETVPEECLAVMCDALVGCETTNLPPCLPGQTVGPDGGQCDPNAEPVQ